MWGLIRVSGRSRTLGFRVEGCLRLRAVWDHQRNCPNVLSIFSVFCRFENLPLACIGLENLWAGHLKKWEKRSREWDMGTT